jgi:alkanesulfonate monooxygenase SsuD/methylene tetrahydromethanopterin reductase-like flavin-dependent oxidoreductase (luciferase family)
MAVGADDKERRAAREGARANIAFYGSTPAYRPVLASVGREDLQPELRDLTRNQRWDQLGTLVDDELVEQVAICGDPDEAAAKLVARCAGGVDRVAMSFAYGVKLETVAAFADAVRARSTEATAPAP